MSRSTSCGRILKNWRRCTTLDNISPAAKELPERGMPHMSIEHQVVIVASRRRSGTSFDEPSEGVAPLRVSVQWAALRSNIDTCPERRSCVNLAAVRFILLSGLISIFDLSLACIIAPAICGLTSSNLIKCCNLKKSLSTCAFLEYFRLVSTIARWMLYLKSFKFNSIRVDFRMQISVNSELLSTNVENLNTKQLAPHSNRRNCPIKRLGP